MKARLIIFFSIIIILFSCEKKDDFSKISKDYRYNAEFAIPVGIMIINLKKFKINLDSTMIKDTTFLKVLLNLNKTMRFQDTVPFDISNLAKDSKYIKNLKINTLISNSFPAKGTINVYFANTFRRIIDTLHSDSTINIKAALDSKIETELLSISIDTSQLKRLSTARYLVFKGIVDNSDVSVDDFRKYNQYSLKIEIGARFETDFNLKDAVQ